MNKKVIVFAPHPDDETLGCGGIICKKISEGYEVFIFILTDGRHAFSEVLGIYSDPNPEEVKQIRREEVIRAAKILGVPSKNLFFLDFEDGKLGECEKEAEERIIELLRKNLPIEVYFPFIRDYHPDHQATNRIVRRCVQKLGLMSTGYQYSIGHKYSRIGPKIERLLDFLKKNVIEVDISEYLDLKHKAIEEFKSEIYIVSSGQKKPIADKIDKFLNTKEKFYIVKR